MKWQEKTGKCRETREKHWKNTKKTLDDKVLFRENTGKYKEDMRKHWENMQKHGKTLDGKVLFR